MKKKIFRFYTIFKILPEYLQKMPGYLQNFANTATGIGLIWAIYTYHSSQVEAMEKEEQNIQELKRIQKKDSTQLALFKKQMENFEKKDKWDRERDTISINYAKRNLDSISSNNRQSINSASRDNRAYLSAFTNVYKNIVKLHKEQNDLAIENAKFQQSLYIPLISISDVQIDSITAHNDLGAFFAYGRFKIVNTGSFPTYDINADLYLIAKGIGKEPNQPSYFSGNIGQGLKFHMDGLGIEKEAEHSFNFVHLKKPLPDQHIFYALIHLTFSSKTNPQLRRNYFRTFAVHLQQTNKRYCKIIISDKVTIAEDDIERICRIHDGSPLSKVARSEIYQHMNISQ